MTRLTRKVRREVSDLRRGDLVITLAEEGIFMRQKGKRTTYGPISYGLVMLQGEKMAAQQLMRERAEKRKLKQLAKRGR